MHTGNIITVRNRLTGDVRQIKAPSLNVLKKAIADGVDKCVGPCKCIIEPDGSCPKGWPSRLIVSGIM